MCVSRGRFPVVPRISRKGKGRKEARWAHLPHLKPSFAGVRILRFYLFRLRIEGKTLGGESDRGCHNDNSSWLWNAFAPGSTQSPLHVTAQFYNQGSFTV